MKICDLFQARVLVANLIRLFIDTISKNGNLLLDIAPKADGSLSEIQMDRMTKFGQWIDYNTEAIFGTRPFLAPGNLEIDAVFYWNFEQIFANFDQIFGQFRPDF